MNESNFPKRIASLNGNGCLKIEQPAMLQRRSERPDNKMEQYILRAKKMPLDLMNFFK